jgi:uncharacterized protein (TIGR02452 family)
MKIMTRQQRTETANQTLEIIGQGFYKNTTGQNVSIVNDVKYAIDNSKHYTPETLDSLVAALTNSGAYETQFEVYNETTLVAAARLAEAGNRVLCLNFASAKNPGGGFLGGSQAQEESLARSSALYPAIEQMQGMYQTNRNYKSCLYTDHMIYSPNVPVFRNDEGQLLSNYYKCSFITAPAVNAGVVTQQEPDNIERIEEVTLRRMEKLLSVAVHHGYNTLLLGAWGCGVFRNNPQMIAKCFHHYLVNDARFNKAFKQVTFAVLDKSANGEIFNAFEQQFKHQTLNS